MMTGDLVTFLLAQGPINELVGKGIRPVKSPSGSALPHITLEQIGAKHDRCNAGRTGLANDHYQITAWGRTDAEAEAVAQAISDAIGAAVNVMMGGTAVDHAEVTTERDMPVINASAQAITTFAKQLDVAIWHAEQGAILQVN